jgi:hypothetical protein
MFFFSFLSLSHSLFIWDDEEHSWFGGLFFVGNIYLLSYLYSYLLSLAGDGGVGKIGASGGAEAVEGLAAVPGG